MDYLIHIAIMLVLYAILAQGFNLVFGVGGLFNLAHASLYAIGAYTTALLSVELDMPVFRCMVASGLFAGLCSLPLGMIALRLSRDYFAIGTLAFSAVISALLVNWRSVTRGVLGIPGIPRPVIGDMVLDDSASFLLFALTIFIACQAVMWILFKGSFGRNLRAQAQYEQAAQSLGRNTRRIRTWTFFASSVMAGIAGSLYAYYLNFIDPTSFTLGEMIFILTIAVVGKPGSFWWMFVSVFLLVALLPEGLRFLPLESSVLGPLRQLIQATILFVVVYLMRERLFPEQRTV